MPSTVKIKSSSLKGVRVKNIAGTLLVTSKMQNLSQDLVILNSQAPGYLCDLLSCYTPGITLRSQSACSKVKTENILVTNLLKFRHQSCGTVCQAI